MPSETAALTDLVAACRAALEPAQAPFHDALARTIEEVRTFLDRRPTSAEEQVQDASASLGAFASGRVDPERFSALLTHSLTIDDSDAERIERAFDVLRELNERLASLLHVRVPAGGDIRDVVATRLAEIGRAFGAAHFVQAIRSGSYEEAEHATLLDDYPFARWSSAERALTPALLVEVDGADLHAPALAEFLDGTSRLVLHVSGASPVAPLARLIAPSTYVLQTDDAAALGALVAWSGTGIAAVLPEGTARFRHDPTAAENGRLRLEVQHLPEARPQPVGGASTSQQEEELALLAAWTKQAEAPAVAPAPAEDDVAGRLAGWLLEHANLDGEE
ncbi:MAG: hypothetical protein QNJ90_00880 [Planctomycetota bacterium]|nr:hypothetical protein [Planctomycetota bacterium]